MKGIRRVIKNIFRYWKTALGALISMLLVTATNLVTPQLLRDLIDNGISRLDVAHIEWVAGGLILVAVGRGVFNFLQGYWSEVTSQGVAFELRNKIFEQLQNLSFSYHDQAQTGMLMTRMTSDVEIVRMFAGNGLLQLLSAVIMLAGTLVILFSMNWLLTLILLASIPFIGVLMVIFIRNMMPLSKVVQVKLGELNTKLQENLSGVRIVKAFAREAYEINRFADKNQALFDVNFSLIKVFVNFFPLVFLVANIAMAAVLWVGGIYVIDQQATIGELVAFMGYQMYLLMPVFMLGFITSALARAEVSAQRIYEVVDAKADIADRPGASELANVKGEVVFDDVSFRYVGSDHNTLNAISFTAKPGKTVAILGQTGSGKSTIINLIPRFYDVTGGKITVDGVDIRDVTLASLRAQIGIVLQETTLFSGTIQENIAYGCPACDLDKIIEAAKIAQADDFISKLPEGYGTLVGERGIGLSGGQKQRIAIARAVLLNPRILIMDDSTSSVDAETEYQIQQALEFLRKGRTTFVIAQRISTIRNADLILLIDKGELIAQGAHAQLMQTSELYAQILETQFGARAELIATVEEMSL